MAGNIGMKAIDSSMGTDSNLKLPNGDELTKRHKDDTRKKFNLDEGINEISSDREAFDNIDNEEQIQPYVPHKKKPKESINDTKRSRKFIVGDGCVSSDQYRQADLEKSNQRKEVQEGNFNGCSSSDKDEQEKKSCPNNAPDESGRDEPNAGNGSKEYDEKYGPFLPCVRNCFRNLKMWFKKKKYEGLYCFLIIIIFLQIVQMKSHNSVPVTHDKPTPVSVKPTQVTSRNIIRYNDKSYEDVKYFLVDISNCINRTKNPTKPTTFKEKWTYTEFGPDNYTEMENFVLYGRPICSSDTARIRKPLAEPHPDYPERLWYQCRCAGEIDEIKMSHVDTRDCLMTYKLCRKVNST